MEESKPNYKCSQDVLYASCELVITSLDEELVSFTALKPKYNAAFVTALRTELLAARTIPALNQRQSEQEVARINLLAKLTLCLDKLNALRLYIRDAYGDVAIREVRLSEAGFDDYDKAANANWEKLEALMSNAKTFIGLHEAELLAGDNMPPTFKAAFDTLTATVNPEVVAMLNMRENNKQGTSNKILANNNLYARIIEACEDGVYIFRNDAAKASQFVWASVTEIITPPGAAGLRGVIRDEVTTEVLVGAVVALKRADLPAVEATNDDEGKYEFDSLPAGDYIGKVTKVGYESVGFTVKIKTGVVSTLNFLLKAEPL
jgi:hypothetical protein